MYEIKRCSREIRSGGLFVHALQYSPAWIGCPHLLLLYPSAISSRHSYVYVLSPWAMELAIAPPPVLPHNPPQP